jgi:hypothetical protein
MFIELGHLFRSEDNVKYGDIIKQTQPLVTVLSAIHPADHQRVALVWRVVVAVACSVKHTVEIPV